MTEEMKSKYFAETAIALRREGFQVEELQNGYLNVMMDDQPLCEVYKIGGITYRDVSTPERTAAKDKAFGIVSTTAEYIRGMELAPPLWVKDLKDRLQGTGRFQRHGSGLHTRRVRRRVRYMGLGLCALCVEAHKARYAPKYVM